MAKNNPTEHVQPKKSRMIGSSGNDALLAEPRKFANRRDVKFLGGKNLQNRPS